MRLVSWIGGNDLDAAEAKTNQLGAVVATLARAPFAELHLLYSYPEERVDNYLSWLSSQHDLPIAKRKAELTSPIDFHDIYLAADALLSDLTHASSKPISVLLSSGTPAMQAVWILLGKTKYPVTFYQASPEQGVQQVDILLTEGGDPDKLGRGHVWNNEIPNCIHQNHIFFIRIKNSQLVRPHFLSAVISSQRGKRYFLKEGKQTTGIATIDKTVLSEFELFVPPLPLQDKYLSLVEKVEGVKQNFVKNDLDLFESLSQKAFSGDL